MDNLNWKTKRWEEVSRDELYNFSRLRINVFVVEQDCPYPEFDDVDQESIHLWAENASGICIAYLRIIPPGKKRTVPSIGRVVVDEEARKSGLGRTLMNKGIDWTQQEFGPIQIKISAQEYLIRFYESLGFSTRGEGYLEDGIPHIEMIR